MATVDERTELPEFVEEVLDRAASTIYPAADGDFGECIREAKEWLQAERERREELEGALDDISEMTNSPESYRVFSGLGSEDLVLAENVVGDVNRRARQALKGETGE